MSKDNDIRQRARLRARWMQRIQDMEPDELLVLVEALRLCAASDREDVEHGLDVIAADIRACIEALNRMPVLCAALDEAVASDVKRASWTVLHIQQALQRLAPKGAA